MLRHLLDASYLYAIDDIPLGQWPRGALLWAMFLLALGGAAILRTFRNQDGRTLVGVGLASCGAAMLWLAVRPWRTGPFSARIWPISLTALSALCAGCAWTWPYLQRLDGPTLRAMALGLGPDEPTLSTRRFWGHSLCHAAGIGAVAAMQPKLIWVAALAGMVLSSSWLIEHQVKRAGAPKLRIELLAPLAILYVATGLRALVQGLGVDVAPYAAFAYPDPWSIWFNGETVALLCGAWMTLAGVSFAGRCLKERRPRLRSTTLALVAPVVAIVWYATLVVRHLSHGATASDPYCYLQMATDLAQRGTALHAFPLAKMVAELGLPTWPVAHMGYHAPIGAAPAPTVWPIGWPVMLAPLFRLGGEDLAMWGAPICLALTALAVWRLAVQMLGDAQESHLVGGLAAALTLTSVEATLRSLVPMADAAAALWTVCLFLCLVKAHKRDGLVWDVLAGVALGIAYWVRHPLLWLGVGAIVFYASGLRNKRGWLKALAFGGAALCMAAPDLAYHARHWGSPWHAESEEWFLISLANIPGAWSAMLRDGLLRRGELGYLWPTVGLGLVAHSQQRRRRVLCWSMVAGLLSVSAFALCYEALRWRDLLALVPLMSLWAAWGMVRLWRRAGSTTIARAAVLGLCLAALAARATPSYRLPFGDKPWVFGFVTHEQRAAFDQLDRLLPADAVVATGLNSGAVERYTGRATVRPAAWTKDEFLTFWRAAEQRGLTIWVLDDGEEMAFWRRSLDTPTEHICDLAIPCLGLGGQRLDRPARLYRLTPIGP